MKNCSVQFVGKIFLIYYRVEIDSKKNYIWNMPDWYEQGEYNSLPEFVVATLETEICYK